MTFVENISTQAFTNVTATPWIVETPMAACTCSTHSECRAVRTTSNYFLVSLAFADVTSGSGRAAIVANKHRKRIRDTLVRASYVCRPNCGEHERNGFDGVCLWRDGCCVRALRQGVLLAKVRWLISETHISFVAWPVVILSLDL